MPLKHPCRPFSGNRKASPLRKPFYVLLHSENTVRTAPAPVVAAQYRVRKKLERHLEVFGLLEGINIDHVGFNAPLVQLAAGRSRRLYLLSRRS